MGILLVYDVTDEASFNNIRNWMRNIEQHASDNVNKVGPLAAPRAALRRLPPRKPARRCRFCTQRRCRRTGS
jgi:hypothetical protein